MSDNADMAVENTDDLDAFEAEFYGNAFDKTEADATDEAEDAPEIDGHSGDDTPEIEDDEPEVTDDSEEDAPDGDEPEEEEKPKPKVKKSAKERIDEITAEKYEERRAREAAERRAAELEARIAKLEAGKVKEEAEPTLREKLPDDAPNPDAKNADGDPVYPLGEFDPRYIVDLTQYTIKAENARVEAEREQAEREKAFRAEQQEIADNWADKLDEFEAEVPEIRENIKGLTQAFQSLEPSYGEYLATTIMLMDHGPEIMNYLSQNLAEASRIVASGAAGATLALGKLEARFERDAAKDEETKSSKKVSKAPEPPVAVSRGQGGRFTVKPDTDDLDAFEREFFGR